MKRDIPDGYHIITARDGSGYWYRVSYRGQSIAYSWLRGGLRAAQEEAVEVALQHERENAVGVEAPLASAGRDQREEAAE